MENENVEGKLLSGLLDEIKSLPLENMDDPKVQAKIKQERLREKARFDALVNQIIAAAQGPNAHKDVSRILKREFERIMNDMV